MTKNEIIEMAKPASWLGGVEGWTFNSYQEIEAFAKLVAEHEREACAKLCEEYETDNDIADTWLNIVSEVIRARGQA